MSGHQAVPSQQSIPSQQRRGSQPRISTRAFTVAGLLLAALVAAVLSRWASSSPDGLESVAASQGFDQAARDSVTAGSPLADYSARFIDHPWASLAVAGLIGSTVTFGLAWLLGRAKAPR